VVYSNQAFFPEGRVAVFPNPFNPNTAKDGKLKFANILPNSTVSIYTLSGDFVRAISSGSNKSASWDATNSSGANVSPGIYFYVITNSGTAGYVMKGKIYLVRN
jgi:flagellar hook assembly protein FlgD